MNMSEHSRQLPHANILITIIMYKPFDSLFEMLSKKQYVSYFNVNEDNISNHS